MSPGKTKNCVKVNCWHKPIFTMRNLVISLDRGGLNVPSDCACQWTFFCFIMFNTVKDKVCRRSLCNMFMSVAEFYSFNMAKHHGMILANIFLKTIVLIPRQDLKDNKIVIVFKCGAKLLFLYDKNVFTSNSLLLFLSIQGLENGLDRVIVMAG